MADKIQLDIISDVVCPWCVIGYKRLEQAITEMKIQDKVKLIWHPFELNPDMPIEGEELTVHLSRKYDMTLDDSIRYLNQWTGLGAELEFMFDYFDGMKMVNTRDAHLLLEYAKEFGKQTELELCLFEMFFSEQKNVSDRQVLTQALQKIGLNINEALTRLDDEDARRQIEVQEAHWHNSGVFSVPTVVCNNSRVLTGAQSVDDFKQVLAELIEHNEVSDKNKFPY